MQGRCRVCGRFVTKSEYCVTHGKEFPDCKNHHECFGSNVCYPNAPYRCARARAEGLCPGYEVGVKVAPPRHSIVNKDTGEVLALGNTGLELMTNFSKTKEYKSLFGEPEEKK